jgi:hypothetical protein
MLERKELSMVRKWWNEIDISALLQGDKLVMAFVQLEGPLPAGKTKVARRGRDTYDWMSRDQINLRIDKAVSIVDQLHNKHPNLNLLVFPEYSLPLNDIVDVMSEKSNKYGVIIVPGSDNVPVGKKGKILNRTKILIPGQSKYPTMAKAHLSQWELTFVDSETDFKGTLLTWGSGRNRYSVAIFLCLDFTLWPVHQLPTGLPGVVLVPMCSPDLDTFRTYADTMLWEDAGRAVVLCNCTGSAFAGSSALFAVTPGGQRLKPALQLSPSREGVAVVNLDCSCLNIPRRTTQTARSPVEGVTVYDLGRGEGKWMLTCADFTWETARQRKRAVVNPYLFQLYDRRLGMTLVSVHAYASLPEAQIRAQEFECYSVLGPHDILITQLYQDPSDMVLAVSHAFPVRNGINTSEHAPDLMPYFEVSHFYKVLGIRVSEDDHAVLVEPPPTDEDLSKLLALARDWNAEGVSKDDRSRLLSRRWILGPSERKPGEIDAVMTLCLYSYDESIARTLDNFDQRVIPVLVANRNITSIFQGTGHRMQVHYVLRIVSGVKQLFDLIEEIHRISTKERFVLTTNTYVIAKKWTDLDLQRAMELPLLSALDVRYLNMQVIPSLHSDDMAQISLMERPALADYVRRCHEADTALNSVRDVQSINKRFEEMVASMRRGMLHGDFEILRSPHDALLSITELVVRGIIEKLRPAGLDKEILSAASIPKGKTFNSISYGEAIRVASQLAKRGDSCGPVTEHFEELHEKTNPVRNAMIHSAWGRITLDEWLSAIKCHCGFIASCDTSPTELSV